MTFVKTKEIFWRMIPILINIKLSKDKQIHFHSIQFDFKTKSARKKTGERFV